MPFHTPNSLYVLYVLSVAVMQSSKRAGATVSDHRRRQNQ